MIATRGDSFVDVRRGDAIGLAEFTGTIERGQKQRFTGRVLWLQVRTPKNVVVKLNGNRVQLEARGEDARRVRDLEAHRRGRPGLTVL